MGIRKKNWLARLAVVSILEMILQKFHKQAKAELIRRSHNNRAEIWAEARDWRLKYLKHGQLFSLINENLVINCLL